MSHVTFQQQWELALEDLTAQVLSDDPNAGEPPPPPLDPGAPPPVVADEDKLTIEKSYKHHAVRVRGRGGCRSLRHEEQWRRQHHHRRATAAATAATTTAAVGPRTPTGMGVQLLQVIAHLPAAHTTHSTPPPTPPLTPPTHSTTHSTPTPPTTQYLKYLQIFRKLEECYDSMTQPQKREETLVVLELVIRRVVELRHLIVKWCVRECGEGGGGGDGDDGGGGGDRCGGAADGRGVA